MADTALLLDHAQNALLLTVLLSLPAVGVAALVSLVMALFQAATQVNDMTIAHLPRFVAVTVTLALSGAWMGGELLGFATRVFGSG
jgi:type III secretion HrpO family protein